MPSEVLSFGKIVPLCKPSLHSASPKIVVGMNYPLLGLFGQPSALGANSPLAFHLYLSVRLLQLQISNSRVIALELPE
jgi:hypothetical protein